ncbi:MAG: helix-turn-helix transcriptional regulator [Anaerolineales bacterium]|nr:helix-turn-helix transcriptional regulator [Anaerolineales bacterium]
MPDREKLSVREAEVLRLVAAGKRNKDIAICLNVSINTVEFHLKNIFSKIGVNNRTEACLFWVSQHKTTTDFSSDRSE